MPFDDLALCDVYRHRVVKVLDDAEPLATIRDDDLVVAYETGAGEGGLECTFNSSV